MSSGIDNERDDYYTECDGCGKRYYGYDQYSITVVDGSDYCPDCCVVRFGFFFDRRGYLVAPRSLYRIAHTFSSLYDGNHHYATTLESVAREADVPMRDLRARHCGKNPMFLNPGYGLSGHIDSEHWEIYAKGWSKSCEFAFVFEPSAEELEKLMSKEAEE